MTRGPLTTLLAGIAIAVALFAFNLRGTPDRGFADNASGDAVATAPALNTGATATSAPPVAPASAAPPAPVAPPATMPETTWAGNVADRSATLAIVARDGQAVAYLCDGERAELWMQGTAVDGRLDLAGKADPNARLTGTFDTGRVQGSVLAIGRQYPFELVSVRKPSGLYRASAVVRNVKVVAGWIVGADGRQIGLGTVDGQVAGVSELDIATGTATVGGEPVGAGPVSPG